MTAEEKKAKTLKALATLMERMEDIEVDPVFAKMGRALGEDVWEQLKPYVVVSGSEQTTGNGVLAWEKPSSS